jgi:hypothetical protein
VVRREQCDLGYAAESIGGDMGDNRLLLRLGVADELGVLGDDVEIGPQPIRWVMAIDEVLEIVFRPAGKLLAQGVLGTSHTLAAAQGQMAAAEQRLGLEIERAQELSLPSRPHSRAYRPDVSHRQKEKQLKPFAALHQRGKIPECLGVVQVTALREQAHGEVMLDEPSSGLGLGGVQSEARTKLPSDARADNRMILLTPLGDVVQEGRDVKGAAIVDGAHDLGRHRMLAGEPSPLDAGEEADSPDQMLVNREVVIHVELHHRHHAAEIGNEAAEHAGLVHLAQHALRVARIHQEPHEQAVGRDLVAQLVVDQPDIGAHVAQHFRRERGLMLVGKHEQLDEVHRILGESLFAHGVDAAVLDAEVRGSPELGAPPPAERRK